MALERPEVVTPESEPSAFSFGPLQAVIRRWPLLLIGLTIGALVGALIQVTSTRIYASSAALLVIKKRPDIVTTSDSRLNIVEDYVSTQLTLIKSEKIRRAAAVELRKSPLSRPLPDDDDIVAGMLNTVNATRDMTQTSSGANNNIVILSVRGTDPRDTRYYLEAIIKAYQNELAGVYDKATRDRLDSLDNARKIQNDNKERLGREMLVQDRALNQITTESTSSIQGRITSSKDKLNGLSLEAIQIKQQLELIAIAGKNRRDRIAVVIQLTGAGRITEAAAGAPGSTEQTIRVLEAKRESLSEKLGKDHPEMKELESQIKFYKAEQARLNPDDPNGMLDELGAIEKNLKQRSVVTALQVKELTGYLEKDEKNLQDAAGIRSQIDLIRLQMNAAQAEIDRLNLEKSNTMVTQNLGGFEATPITPPAFGGQVAPVLFTSIGYGFVIGMLVGGGAIALAELSDRSFRSPTEIRRRLGVPVIGHIPELRTATAIATVDINVEPALVSGLRPKSNEAEAYRGVRTQLYFSTQGRGHQVIQVTSPSPGDGKSTLAANLATVIAQSGKRVVLIDCDFRKPQVHKIFRLGDVECGLADVVAGTAPMAKALRRSVIPGLDLMPCGPRPSNPAELLTSPRFDQVLKDLKDAYDFVVVDTPPMLAVSDPANVAAKADGVIMVFRMTRNVRPQAERSVESLNAIGANILGLVVNGGGDGNQGYGSYNYGQGYGYKYTYYEYSKTYGEEEDLKELAAKKK